MQVTPVQLSILVALTRADLHGYAILQDLAGAGAPLRPGTLYRAIRQLVTVGYIIEVDPPRAQGADLRRRFYRITADGRTAARTEARALSGLLVRARRSGLLDHVTEVVADATARS